MCDARPRAPAVCEEGRREPRIVKLKIEAPARPMLMPPVPVELEEEPALFLM